MSSPLRLSILVLFCAAACTRAAQVRPESVEPTRASVPSVSSSAGEGESDAPAAVLAEPQPPETVREKLAPPVIRFGFDSTEVSASEREKLAAWASFVLSTGVALPSITIEGHADERGTEEYNLVLGEKRASSVRTYLSRMGIDAARLKTLSFGEARPQDPSRTEDAFASNRRAEVRVSQQ